MVCVRFKTTSKPRDPPAWRLLFGVKNPKRLAVLFATIEFDFITRADSKCGANNFGQGDLAFRRELKSAHKVSIPQWAAEPRRIFARLSGELHQACCRGRNWLDFCSEHGERD